jgi:hypothetical protein
MFYAIARAVSLGLPWLAVMAISATMAYGMNMVMTSGVPIATRADKSVSIVRPRPLAARPLSAVRGASMSAGTAGSPTRVDSSPA